MKTSNLESVTILNSGLEAILKEAFPIFTSA